MNGSDGSGGGISETVSEISADTLTIEEIRDPVARVDAIQRVEAGAQGALAHERSCDLKIGRLPENVHPAYERVFDAAEAECRVAWEQLVATAKRMRGRTDEGSQEEVERAEFKYRLAAAKVNAINTAEAEWDLELSGDERKLGALKKLGRRGRPRVASDKKLREITQGSIPSGATSRTRLNAWHSSVGASALGLRRNTDDPQRRALIDFFLGSPGGGARAFKAGALVEIGRIADKFGAATARKLAEAVYEKYRVLNSKPRTRDIANDLRAWRLENEGRNRSNGQDGLYRKLTRLIAEHRSIYTELPLQEVLAVMFRVQDDISAEID